LLQACDPLHGLGCGVISDLAYQPDGRIQIRHGAIAAERVLQVAGREMRFGCGAEIPDSLQTRRFQLRLTFRQAS
jgi:hypothetical protein